MKKLLLFAFLLSTLILPIPAFGIPEINSISFNPSQEIWTEEALEIIVNGTECSYVNATMVGETGYTIYVENFILKNGLYTTKINPIYWRDRPDSFSVTIYCFNGSEIAQKTTKVNVSKFNVEIQSIHPSIIYLNDIIEINVLVKKNTQHINSPDVKFKITIDGLTQKSEIRPPYDPYSGWIIFLNSSEVPAPIGAHELQITVFYDRVNSTKITSFIINEPIQFSILSLDKTWVKPNDTVNLKIQATEKGSIIPLTKENLEIKIDKVKANILTISPSGNLFSVIILAPNLPPSSYSLTAFLNHKNYTYTSVKNVDYITSISGKFVDENGKGVSVKLSFFSGDVEKLRLYTDSAGAYSGNLPPGIYDVEIVFPQSTLRLHDAKIEGFEDPIKYYYFDSVYVEGLNVAGLFVYEVAIPYYKASIEMKYNEGNILNENLIKVYKCENWNSGKKECYGKWSEVPVIVDTIRNIVYINTTSLSAYAIGTLKKLSVEFNLNKEVFHLKDLVKLRGMVVDEHKNPVRNASVSIKIKDTTISAKTFSDSNGLFVVEFLTPEEERNYSLTISVEKYPYLSFNSSIDLKVERSKEVSIIFPDTIRIKQGETLTQDFSIINIGQSKLYNLSISLIGIPNEFYHLISEIEELEIGEERKLLIVFNIPEDASIGTSSATIKVFNNEIKKDKIFGFTVLEKNQTVTAKPTAIGFFGKIVLPQISLEPIHVLIFALIAFSLAFLLKRRKIEKQERSEIKNALFDLKGYLKSRESEAPAHQIIQKIEEKLEEGERGIG